MSRDEEEQLRSVVRGNAETIQVARQRAEQDLLRAKDELERQAHALQNSAERLQLALSAGRLGDWNWDASTDEVHLSPRAAAIFGLPAQVRITWTEMREMLHRDDAERAQLAVEKSLAGHSDYSIEYRVTRPAGDQCWIAAKGAGLYARMAQ